MIDWSAGHAWVTGGVTFFLMCVDWFLTIAQERKRRRHDAERDASCPVNTIEGNPLDRKAALDRQLVGPRELAVRLRCRGGRMTRRVIPGMIGALALGASLASAAAISREARAALVQVLPEGYRTVAIVPCLLEGSVRPRFVAALVDTDEAEPEKVVRLLYLAWTDRWSVLDSVELAGSDPRFAPQYLNGISVVRVGPADLLYVNSNWSRGGSGSPHYFQFFRATAERLELVRAFEHERMERGLLCLRNDRIYDAVVACRRGEKKGGAYLYFCHLDTTEYTFVNGEILAARHAKLEERTGNRFLDETYRNLSLRSLLRRGSFFPLSD